MPPLSLSTCWCSHRHTDGYAMAREIADLGFDYMELSHGVRITLVPGVIKAVEEGIIKVSSTHNFCPLPTGVTTAAPNLFEPSAQDEREQEQWFRHTKRSIDFAAQMGASVVVCHLGSVKFFWFNPGRKLRAYPHTHPKADIPYDPGYQTALRKGMEKLRKRMGPFWDQTKASIQSVLDYAKQKGVRLGFENREKFEELPIDADYPEFLATFPADAPVGYWHDTGHADIKQKMGLLDHRSHLEAMSSRLIGFHLHDVNDEGDDHQPIGSGHIDFKMVSSFWRPEHKLILEFSPRLKPEDVTRSKERIESLQRVR